MHRLMISADAFLYFDLINLLCTLMLIAEINSSRTSNLSPFTKGYRGLASRMQLVTIYRRDLLMRICHSFNAAHLGNPK